jgi:hypothetical protein
LLPSMAIVAGCPGALELAMKVAPRMFKGGRSKRHVPSAQNSKKLRDHPVQSPTLLVTTRRQWQRAAQCACKIRTHGRISSMISRLFLKKCTSTKIFPPFFLSRCSLYK